MKAPRSSDDLALQRHLSMSRRNFLRGMGACVALPTFAALVPARAFGAQAAKLGVTASGAPLRTAFVYFPNGAIPATWWPATEGSNFSLNRTLPPLAAHQKQIQVLGELNHLNAMAGTDGGGDHARAN